MKKSFILVILILASLLSFAQFVVSPALSDAIKDGKTEYLDVNIFFENAESVSDLAVQFDNYHADFDTRVKGVTALLKRNYEKSHAKFMKQIDPLMRSNPDAVESMEGYWIVNAVNVKVHGDIIGLIAGFDNVTYIDLNVPRYRIVDGTNLVEENAQRSANGVEWGVRAINAPAMWALGYTGHNILMLSIDTGVNPEHSAISSNYAGNNFPQSQCWYGMRHDRPRDNASSSHGTHTTGTAMGLDRATNDTIGIAYNAKWIACDPVASTSSELLTVSQFFSVYQWVLNPDGDENTTSDVPRVINNSWGYDYEQAEEFACSLPENSIVETLEAAGICSPFSAGNEGPGVSTTGYPAMLAYNVVNPMSVAAVNSNNVVASFSSRGPTPCVDEESSLKIKPEVSAPGVNVRSCVGFDGYDALQGTSMACPHVSGALLLLAEAFPMASARELKEALYYSAIDLGDEGEDNTYGMGMIDVMAAYNYLSNTYTPAPPVSDDFDISVELRMSYGVSPVNYDTVTCIESVPAVYATLHNNGIDDAGDVILQVFSGDSLIATTTWHNVDAGSEVNYEYEIPEVPVHGGLNELRAVVSSMTYGVEYDTYNNSAMLRFYMYFYKDFPFEIDFNEGGFFSKYGIVIGNPNGKKTWEMLPWGGNSEHKAMGYSFSKNYVNKDVDYAYLPQTDLPDADSLYLNFIYAYRKQFTSSVFMDTLAIELSTDCGATFPYVLWKKGGADLLTMAGNSSSFYMPVDYSEFDTVSVNLANFKGENVMLRFVSINANNSELYINKVSLDSHCLDVAPEYLSNVLPEMEVFPNPSNGMVKVILPESCIGKQLVLYDVYGREMATYMTDSQIISMDLSMCADGVYFITAEGYGSPAKIVLLKK